MGCRSGHHVLGAWGGASVGQAVISVSWGGGCAGQARLVGSHVHELVGRCTCQVRPVRPSCAGGGGGGAGHQAGQAIMYWEGGHQAGEASQAGMCMSLGGDVPVRRGQQATMCWGVVTMCCGGGGGVRRSGHHVLGGGGGVHRSGHVLGCGTPGRQGR